MKPSLHKLQKFFKLEADRGYDNHAVLGGLERMLDHWVPEAREDGVPEDLIQAVIHRLHDYARLAPRSRAETLDGLWRRVQRTVSVTPPSPVTTEEVPIPKARPIQQEPKIHPAAEIIPEPEGPELQPETPPAEPEIQDVSPAAPKPALPPRESVLSEEAVDLGLPVTILSGVGQRYSQILGELGILTLGDMLYYFPRRYDDYTLLKPINRLAYREQVTIIGTVQSISIRPIRSGQMVEAIISDGTGSIRVNWFNQVHIGKRLHPGVQVSLSGKTDQYLGRVVMTNPEWELLEQEQLNTNRIVPVYRLTARITQGWLRRMINQCVLNYAPRVAEPLPQKIQDDAGLVGLHTALTQIHFPDSVQDLKQAQVRLAFDEVFFLQLGVLQQKREWQERPARVHLADDTWMNNLVANLKFTLTTAQQRVLQDIRTDLSSGRPMNRLIQGDVGSGKTIIAAMGMAIVNRSGSQSALMAPTGILAEQHYKNLLQLFNASRRSESEPEEEQSTQVPPLLQADQIRLLVGSTPESEKQQIRAGLSDGSIKLLVGTHALIEDPIQFSDLQMVVVDEQHRFGVEQRAALRQKGDNPHLLVMTATPIPRTLALTIYGDLDISLIDEMPAGRQPVGTFVLHPRERERAYSLIRNQVKLGRQAFIIYPLVEESENSEARAAVEEFKRLSSEIFPDLQLALLHGRMKPEEKDQAMAGFRDMQTQILVSTSVIEVGVDIPNATVMLIEGANRFGLAQLHQFRGRVGRGAEKAYCLLIPETADEVENERLQVMEETNDGFILAERDLEQRGPGQFLGSRQSGYTDFRLLSATNIEQIEKARRLTQALIEQDPDLGLPEHQLLANTLKKSWLPQRTDIS